MVVSTKKKDIGAVNVAAYPNKLFHMASGSFYDEDKNMIHNLDRKLISLKDLKERADGESVLIA